MVLVPVFGNVYDDRAKKIIGEQFPDVVKGMALLPQAGPGFEAFINTLADQQEDFALADATRAELDEIGIVLEDKPDETRWRRK